jgi:hypothetical protein
VEKVNEAAKDKVDIDADVLKVLAYTAAGELSPMAALFGGLVGQEVRALVPHVCNVNMRQCMQGDTAGDIRELLAAHCL